MSKHTPGPWGTAYLYSTRCPENACVDVLAAPKSEKHSGLKIAEASFSCIESDYHVTNRGEAEANARLIAAAPELLFALQNLLAVQAGEGGTAYHSGDIARAAIAKATGEGA
jgi:hypothetical protein